jgi:hypothetical protein
MLFSTAVEAEAAGYRRCRKLPVTVLATIQVLRRSPPRAWGGDRLGHSPPQAAWLFGV